MPCDSNYYMTCLVIMIDWVARTTVCITFQFKQELNHTVTVSIQAMSFVHWLVTRPIKPIMNSPAIMFTLFSLSICELLRWRRKFTVTCFNLVYYVAISLCKRVSSLSKMVLVRAEPTSWADLEALEGF